jgi:hypothetical protein
LVSQQYLRDLEARVSDIRTKPVDSVYLKQTNQEINQRQGVRLSIIKEQMKESLIQSQAI